MATPYDVASYIVSKCDLMTTMKMQRLVYYSYSMYAGIYGTPLFDEEFEAWRIGPVVRSLYKLHRREIFAEVTLFDEGLCLKAEETRVIDKTLALYKSFSANELCNKILSEDPWKITRGDLDSFVKSYTPIPFELVKRWATCEYVYLK